MPLTPLTPQIKRSLWRLNWLVSIIVSLLVYLFSSLNKDAPALVFAVFTATQLFLNGAIHTFIFSYYVKRGRTGSFSYKFQRFIASYFYSAVIYLIKINLYNIASFDIDWSYTDFKFYGTLILISGIINTLIIILHDFVILQHRKAQTEVENIQLKAAVSEASNLVLKQQVHPHFLFNSLNTLKVLYEVDVAQGEAYLIHLADYLRAAISDHNTNISSLASELQLCHNYMEMQRIRFGDALQYHVSVTKEAEGALVPFFSLQPLLENAIKHNELTVQSPLYIQLTQEGEWVTVANNLQPKRRKEASTGQGLLNLAQRYRLWTGDEIMIKDDTEQFSVSIKLKNDGGSNHRG